MASAMPSHLDRAASEEVNQCRKVPWISVRIGLQPLNRQVFSVKKDPRSGTIRRNDGNVRHRQRISVQMYPARFQPG